MFKASLDKVSKVIPAVMLLFSLVTIVIGLVRETNDFLYLSAFPAMLVLVVTAGCYVYSPQGYSVQEDSILVHRRVGSFSIPRKDIQSLVPLDRKELGRCWRLAGNGGVFGYTGWFSSSTQGKMRWFVTRRDRALLIVLHSGRKYLLSPDEPQAMLDALS